VQAGSELKRQVLPPAIPYILSISDKTIILQ